MAHLSPPTALCRSLPEGMPWRCRWCRCPNRGGRLRTPGGAGNNVGSCQRSSPVPVRPCP
eukprot:11280893-Alexandrium_andersonii.AAC.1